MKIFYRWEKCVKIGSSGVVSVSSDMTCSIQVHFYAAISNCKEQHTKKSKLNCAGASYKFVHW